MNQSKKSAFVESLLNICIGYCIALASQLIIFPIYGINIALSTNIWIGLWFTVISLIRTYLIRRWFNAKLHAVAEAMVK